MRRTSPAQYAEALAEITQHASGKELDAAIRAFVQLLVRHRKLRQIDKIIAAFEAQMRKKEGYQMLKITAGRALENKVKKAILDAFGGKGEIEEAMDETIIGGVKIQSDDAIYDATINTRLAKLNHQLASTHLI